MGLQTKGLPSQYFPWGPVVNSLLSNAGKMGPIPRQGTKIPYAAGQLYLHATPPEPTHSRACALQQEKPLQWEAYVLQWRAHAPQWRPNRAKTKNQRTAILQPPWGINRWGNINAHILWDCTSRENILLCLRWSHSVPGVAMKLLPLSCTLKSVPVCMINYMVTLPMDSINSRQNLRTDMTPDIGTWEFFILVSKLFCVLKKTFPSPKKEIQQIKTLEKLQTTL